MTSPSPPETFTVVWFVVWLVGTLVIFYYWPDGHGLAFLWFLLLVGVAFLYEGWLWRRWWQYIARRRQR